MKGQLSSVTSDLFTARHSDAVEVAGVAWSWLSSLPPPAVVSFCSFGLVLPELPSVLTLISTPGICQLFYFCSSRDPQLSPSLSHGATRAAVTPGALVLVILVIQSLLALWAANPCVHLLHDAPPGAWPGFLPLQFPGNVAPAPAGARSLPCPGAPGAAGHAGHTIPASSRLEKPRIRVPAVPDPYPGPSPEL